MPAGRPPSPLTKTILEAAKWLNTKSPAAVAQRLNLNYNTVKAAMKRHKGKDNDNA